MAKTIHKIIRMLIVNGDFQLVSADVETGELVLHTGVTGCRVEIRVTKEARDGR
jgi:hypothetical protein